MSNSTGVSSLGVKQLESGEEHLPPTELEFWCVHYIKQPLFSKMMKYRFNITTNGSVQLHNALHYSTCDWLTCFQQAGVMWDKHWPFQCWNLSIKKQTNLMSDFFWTGKVRKVTCWWWKISVVHWCQLAIHSHDNVHVLDSDSSYTWMIMCWWVWASVCHETRMTEWWEWERARSRPVSPHYTPTNLSPLDINENNRADSEMDGCPLLSTLLFVRAVFPIFDSYSSFSPW